MAIRVFELNKCGVEAVGYCLSISITTWSENLIRWVGVDKPSPWRPGIDRPCIYEYSSSNALGFWLTRNGASFILPLVVPCEWWRGSDTANCAQYHATSVSAILKSQYEADLQTKRERVPFSTHQYRYFTVIESSFWSWRSTFMCRSYTDNPVRCRCPCPEPVTVGGRHWPEWTVYTRFIGIEWGLEVCRANLCHESRQLPDFSYNLLPWAVLFVEACQSDGTLQKLVNMVFFASLRLCTKKILM